MSKIESNGRGIGYIIALGIVPGALIGAALGALFGNVALGIAFGAPVGAVFVIVLRSAQERNSESNEDE